MASDLNIPLAPLSLVDGIVDRLERAIIMGELAPGSRLSEIALASSLRVSRGPLREAMQRLEGRRLVRRVPHAGTRVISLSPAELRDVLLTREALEGTAARLAAERMTEGEIKQLYAVIRNFARSGQDAHSVEDRKADFHGCVALGSHNAYLIDLLCKDLYYLLRLYRYRSGALPGRKRSTLAEHLAVADAIAARDASGAEALMREHLRNGRERLLDNARALLHPRADPRAARNESVCADSAA